jgi:2-phospho-L-lactate guanylyltransferase
MHTVAVLPIKSFSHAKQRLGVALGDDDRRQLARAMVGDVLDALARVPRLDGVVVVTREPLAAEAAREAGAFVVTDEAEAGQSAAAARGIEAAVSRGAKRVLLVPGDCPALDPAEVDSLLAAASERRSAAEVVIVADRHGTGTNALLLTPPTVMEPSFGPGSQARHAAGAQAAGADLHIAELTSLEHDVDTAADLAAVRTLLGSPDDRATRTRAVLAALGSAADGSRAAAAAGGSC